MLRITGGAWRGRKLETLEGEATRPSMDAHRLSLFNVIGQDLGGERVLDLFAGTGAFGLECMSRGAARAVLVEASRAAVAVVRKNVTALGPEPGTVEVLAADCYALPALPGPFDLIFVAPPYPHFRSDRARLDRLIASLGQGPAPLLAEDGLAIVQSDAGDFDGAGVAGLARAGGRRWGRTDFTFLRRA